MYNRKLLMMGKKVARNMQSFMTINLDNSGLLLKRKHRVKIISYSVSAYNNLSESVSG